MDDFTEMLNELNIDLKELNIYIESDKFKPISVKDLNLLKTETVMDEIKKVLN